MRSPPAPPAARAPEAAEEEAVEADEAKEAATTPDEDATGESAMTNVSAMDSTEWAEASINELKEQYFTLFGKKARGRVAGDR